VPSLNSLPLDLAGIAAESQKQPDQDLIDKIDEVSSAFQHIRARLTWITDAGPHRVWSGSA